MFKFMNLAVLLAALLIVAVPAISVSAQLAPLTPAECGPLGIECAGEGDTPTALSQTILTVLIGLLVLVGVIALIFVIYGGLKYITSGGDEAGAKEGKKAVQYAIMGIIIIGIAGIIVNFALNAVGLPNLGGPANLPAQLLTIINIFMGLLGVIALVFVVIGGLKYVTSAGDQGVAEEGKKAVQYAVTGLLIIGAAAIIVNFTLSAVGLQQIPGGANLPGALWTIVNAFLALVGVIALIFVVIGGTKYITSAGDETGAEEGKKTVLNAVIGLVVIGLATVIVNFAFAAVGQALPLPGGGDLAGAIWLVANSFLMLVGIIALVFVVIGGVRYVVSQGESDETEKAKGTILYALIGLIVIGLSAVIVNFVLSAV